MDTSELLHEIVCHSNHMTSERYQQILALTMAEISQRYAHMSPRFFPNHTMQAKIQLHNRTVSMLKRPEPYIQTLLDQRFLPESIVIREVKEQTPLSSHQYLLVNTDLTAIGYEFMLQATLGQSFIAVAFRNLSKHWRLDIPLFYALEILNRVEERINRIDLKHYAPGHRRENDAAADNNNG